MGMLGRRQVVGILIRQLLFDELFPRKKIWPKRWGVWQTSEPWGAGASCSRRSLVNCFHPSGHLGQFLTEKEVFVLVNHQLFLERLILLLDKRLFALKLLDFLSLPLSR